MKSEKLFKFLYLLIDKKSMRATDVAKELEVSTRTVYRYIDSLSLAGIPIYTVKGSGGGIRLLDTFKLTKSMLTDIEQREVLAGLTLLNALDENNTDDALIKLKAIFAKSPENWIEVDFSQWGSSKSQRKMFDSIKKSIIENITINLSYINSTGKISFRYVDPLKIVFKGRSWYLIAQCHSRNSLRIFKITRISDVSITNKHFSRELYDLTDYNPFIGSPPDTIDVIMHIDRKLKHRVYDEFDLKNISENNSGYTVKFKASQDNWLYSYVTSFQGYAHIVSPSSINDDIKQWLKNTLNKFST